MHKYIFSHTYLDNDKIYTSMLQQQSLNSTVYMLMKISNRHLYYTVVTIHISYTSSESTANSYHSLSFLW